MKEISTIGIDIAKSKFRVVGMDAAGRVVKRKWLYREEMIDFMAKVRPCLIGMEACAGSNYWGRKFQEQGHTVRLMAPKFVKAYVKTNKNDTNDAEACAEAVTRPTMRFVEIKSERQQEVLQLHRARERTIRVRTAVGNEIRGFLGEFGLVFPTGLAKLRWHVRAALERHSERLSRVTIEMINRLCEELRRAEEEVEFYDGLIQKEHKSMPESLRLDTIPGIGEVTATALVATVSSVKQFRNGRHFSAFLGLVPKQHSTGGKSRLGGISKRGDAYIRKLLIQGAQSVLQKVGGKKDRYSCWVRGLMNRRGWNRTVIAIANKNARIAWALLAGGHTYDVLHEQHRLAA